MLKLKLFESTQYRVTRDKSPHARLIILLLHGHTNALTYANFFDLLKLGSIPIKLH